MTTLIAVYNGSGRCIARCDARCYRAVGEGCHCVCGGELHGLGEEQAGDRVAEAAGVDVGAWAAERGVSTRLMAVQMVRPTS